MNDRVAIRIEKFQRRKIHWWGRWDLGQVLQTTREWVVERCRLAGSSWRGWQGRSVAISRATRFLCFDNLAFLVGQRQLEVLNWHDLSNESVAAERDGF